jgi:Pyruvate kinase, barrel domain
MRFVGVLASLCLVLAPSAAFMAGIAQRATTTTALKSGMEAYDAQMRALSAGMPISVGGGATVMVPAPPTPAPAPSGKVAQRWRKKTKQLATLGPASSTFEMIEKLFLAGADVFRLNFSHGEHAQKKELLDVIRAVEAKYDHPIAILGDLQGPKLRVGKFANPDGEMLIIGQILRFDLDPTPGTNQRVMLPHPEIIEASEVGHYLLIDDGKVKVRVVGKGLGYIDCQVEVAGKIKDKKVWRLQLWLGCKRLNKLADQISASCTMLSGRQYSRFGA